MCRVIVSVIKLLTDKMNNPVNVESKMKFQMNNPVNVKSNGLMGEKQSCRIELSRAINLLVGHLPDLSGTLPAPVLSISRNLRPRTTAER